MTRIFISYSRQDSTNAAKELKIALNKIKGVNVWLDDQLRGEWQTEIEKQIKDCDWMVVLCSPDIIRADSFVRKEIVFAEQLKKKIIPLIVQSVEPEPLPIGIINLQRIDGQNMTTNERVVQLCQLIGINNTPRIKTSVTFPSLPLQSPFEWIPIPHGKVYLIADEKRDKKPRHKKSGHMPEDRECNVPDFLISKYPITNAQYSKFIDENGYINDRYWTREGLKKRNEKQWQYPEYWDDNQWNKPLYPVVGISWYEAVAFCKWLSDLTKRNIMLPSQGQWQRAAQGDDNRKYPWGDNWDEGRCNFNNKGTTSVNLYEEFGASPYGVVDMVGNVWEWLRTSAERSQDLEIHDERILHGGSWQSKDSQELFTYNHQTHFPSFRYKTRGFRIVCFDYYAEC